MAVGSAYWRDAEKSLLQEKCERGWEGDSSGSHVNESLDGGWTIPRARRNPLLILAKD